MGVVAQCLAEWLQGIGSCTSHSLTIEAALRSAGAVLRSPTGPGQHDVVLLPAAGLVVDVTATQFLPVPDPAGIGQRFLAQLYQTGVWTLAEYNDFLSAIRPGWHR